MTIAGLQVDHIAKAAGVVADMRKVFRQDPRIIQKLHRRVFLDKITQEQVCRPYYALQFSSCFMVTIMSLRGCINL